MKRIVIIGGGITGLAAAYYCQQQATDAAVTLVEQDPRLGGKILTERNDGFVVEGAPDSFLSRKPRGVGLCAALGIADRLQGRKPEHARSFVRRHGQLHPLPSGLSGMIPTNLDALRNSTLISPAGRERLAQEPTLPSAPANGDESVAQFITRRLGAEVYEQLVEPLMSGIYGGNGDQLSLAATFPQLRQLELQHGSLLQGLQAGQSNDATANGTQSASPVHPPFVTLLGGMATLVETLEAKLEQVQLLTGTSVAKLASNDQGYHVLLKGRDAIEADAVVVTTPAFATAQLLAELDPALAAEHVKIPYVSAAIITLAFDESDIAAPLDGYGYVIPQVEGDDLLACTWTSSKWRGRTPEGQVLLRLYAGRFGRQDVAELADNQLLTLATEELRRTLGIDARPSRTWIHRWPRAMPQYLLGHPERLRTIDALCTHHLGLYLAGSAYRGVGIPDCIESGERAAAAALNFLATAQ